MEHGEYIHASDLAHLPLHSLTHPFVVAGVRVPELVRGLT